MGAIHASKPIVSFDYKTQPIFPSTVTIVCTIQADLCHADCCRYLLSLRVGSTPYSVEMPGGAARNGYPCFSMHQHATDDACSFVMHQVDSMSLHAPPTLVPSGSMPLDAVCLYDFPHTLKRQDNYSMDTSSLLLKSPLFVVPSSNTCTHARPCPLTKTPLFSAPRRSVAMSVAAPKNSPPQSSTLAPTPYSDPHVEVCCCLCFFSRGGGACTQNLLLLLWVSHENMTGLDMETMQH